MKLCFASANPNKVSEIAALLPKEIELVGLRDIGFTGELAETQKTLEANALQKALYIWEHYHINVFADDTGLEVDALGGAPGVFSARYAGEEKDSSKNIALLLSNLKGQTNRSARFKTAIALVLDGDIFEFDGVLEGSIAHEPKGKNGFGYDPVFVPEGMDITLAECTPDFKNRISHRAKAFHALLAFLQAAGR
jgi:XTP/dITP diphosphohydrolase